MRKNSINLSPSTSLQSSRAFKGQFIYIMTSLSRFSTPKWHHHKLVNKLIIEKIHLVLIYELGMLKIRCAKNPTFGNLDSLVAHHINKSKTSTFSTWNLWNKDNSTLKRPLVTSWVEATNQTIQIKLVVHMLEDLGL
jgi:hypothetical protein